MRRFVWHRSWVDAAQDNLDAASSIGPRYLIASPSRLTIHAYSYKVHIFDVAIDIEGTNEIVRVGNLIGGLSKRSKEPKAHAG
jgi:hypothetical protein